jgi:hypothetical protein
LTYIKQKVEAATPLRVLRELVPQAAQFSARVNPARH